MPREREIGSLTKAQRQRIEELLDKDIDDLLAIPSPQNDALSKAERTKAHYARRQEEERQEQLDKGSISYCCWRSQKERRLISSFDEEYRDGQDVSSRQSREAQLRQRLEAEHLGQSGQGQAQEG